jgi:hypothetical protein
MKLPASAKYRADWHLHSSDATGHIWQDDSIQIILLQEIRDELQRLNALLSCQNFVQMPHVLRAIQANTARPGRRRSPAKKKAEGA